MLRTCHRHNIKVLLHDECPACVAELEQPRPVTDMSQEERLAEIESWAGDDVVLEVEAHRLEPRLNALVDRTLFVEEFSGDGPKIVVTGK